MKPLDSILNFIAPHHCLNCSTEGEVCCQKCLDEITDPTTGKVCYRCNQKSLVDNGICASCRPNQSLNSVYWYTDYGAPLAAKLVKSLKFNHTYSACRPISKGISDLIPAPLEGVIITAIPTANKRIRARGWDQAKLIAKAIAGRNRVQYRSLLVRKSSFDQIGASRHQRSEASKKFFKPFRRALIKDKVVLLVDDVLTTGSTLDSAAQALKSAGAKEVHAIVFARQGLKPSSVG